MTPLDEQDFDRILHWYKVAYYSGNIANDEGDHDLAEKLKAARRRVEQGECNGPRDCVGTERGCLPASADEAAEQLVACYGGAGAVHKLAETIAGIDVGHPEILALLKDGLPGVLPHHCTEEGCWGQSEELPKTADGRFEIRTTRDPNTGEIPELAGYFVYDLLYGRQMFHAVSSARCRAWVSGYDEGLRAA